ncbi:MAG: formimidoylglutamase [Bacteroidetes bacterium]|nr:formimidoylglutamase [Bacteroidota bacterium]
MSIEKDISIYFQPVAESFIEKQDKYLPTQLGNSIESFTGDQDFPEVSNKDIALIGIKEERGCVHNKGCALAPDFIRKYLYWLYTGNYTPKIADIGNIAPGENIEDTYFALSNTVAALVKKKIVPVIIGGGQDLTYANYTAYVSLDRVINMVIADNVFDLGISGREKIDSGTFLSKIILHKPNYLFNYSNIGYQSYFVDQNAMGLMNKLNFDIHRLGTLKENFTEVEPIVRNADLLSVDISAVRFADAPGNAHVTPNGFNGEEICRIMRYAGLSNKLSSIGIYEINPKHDIRNQTVHLAAQMIWYFIDGFYQRVTEQPGRNKGGFLSYRVQIQDEHEIIFYKSKKSERWWMEVPYPVDKDIKFKRHHLVPCSYADYIRATREEIPERWWTAYQKLI